MRKPPQAVLEQVSPRHTSSLAKGLSQILTDEKKLFVGPLQSSKTQYSTMPGNFGFPFAELYKYKSLDLTNPAGESAGYGAASGAQAL